MGRRSRKRSWNKPIVHDLLEMVGPLDAGVCEEGAGGVDAGGSLGGKF